MITTQLDNMMNYLCSQQIYYDSIWYWVKGHQLAQVCICHSCNEVYMQQQDFMVKCFKRKGMFSPKYLHWGTRMSYVSKFIKKWWIWALCSQWEKKTIIEECANIRKTLRHSSENSPGKSLKTHDTRKTN